MNTSDRSVTPVQSDKEISEKRAAAYLRLGAMKPVQLCRLGRITKPARTT
jgi:hypothetical protein